MIILTSHGTFCEGAYYTLGMIAGNDNVEYVVFDGKNIDEYENELLSKVNNSKEPIIICTDILGGTPYNTSVKMFGKNENITILSGFNIPLIIGLKYCKNNMEIEQLILEQSITLYKKVEDVEEDIVL